MSLLVQPEGDELMKTECFSELIASVQLDRIAPASEWKIRLGDKAVLSEQIQARTVTYSLEPS